MRNIEIFAVLQKCKKEREKEKWNKLAVIIKAFQEWELMVMESAQYTRKRWKDILNTVCFAIGTDKEMCGLMR